MVLEPGIYNIEFKEELKWYKKSSLKEVETQMCLWTWSIIWKGSFSGHSGF